MSQIASLAGQKVVELTAATAAAQEIRDELKLLNQKMDCR